MESSEKSTETVITHDRKRYEHLGLAVFKSDKELIGVITVL